MIKGIGVETVKQLEGFTNRIKGETKSIKTVIKNEIEGEKEHLWKYMEEITNAIDKTGNNITRNLHGTRDSLVETNNKLGQSVSETINETNSKVDGGVKDVNEDVDKNKRDLEDNMKSGLGEVS